MKKNRLPSRERCLRLGLLLLSAVLVSAGPVNETARSIRIRIEWGGGKPVAWSGFLELSEGRLESPASLGVEADEPGTLFSAGRMLRLQNRAPRIYNGLDVTVVAKPTAELSFTLQSANRNARQTNGETSHPIRKDIRFSLAELEKTKSLKVGEGDGRILLRRVPGDELSFKIDRSHLVFDPGETVYPVVRWNPIVPPSSTNEMQFDWELTEARTLNVLQRGTSVVNAGIKNSTNGIEIPFHVTLPEMTGVFDLHGSLSGRGSENIKSTMQVVVLSGERGNGVSASRLQNGGRLVDSFRPEKASPLRRVEKRSGVKLFQDAFQRIFRSDSHDENEASTSSLDVQWKAYRLRLRRIGVPHRVVIHVDPERSQNVGISLLEPNASGQLMPVGIDSGLFLPRPMETGDALEMKDPDQNSIPHELLCWPKVREPVLMLHDIGTGKPFQVSKVDVYETGVTQTEASTEMSQQQLPQRLIGPYMHKPLLPENFGSAEAFDEESGRSLDDWVTFLSAAERLCDYLHFRKFNSLMIGVYADGSTIYPSKLLEPTPRYDTGVYFSTGQDPLRKDVLELLYRKFDREQLVLIPELQFSTPLPALERQLRRGGSATRGIELIGRQGKSRRQLRGSRRGLAPYYNPLDPRVQQAVLDVVKELAQRYGEHESFQGVAVEISSAGFLQFPGLQWGYDDATVHRFEQATGIRVPEDPEDENFQRRYEFLTTDARREWVRWRCEELARFYRKLADVVTDANPQAKLILAGNRILRGDNTDEDIYQAAKAGRKLSDLLAQQGLDFQLLSDTDHLVVLRPWLQNATDRDSGSALDETLNRSLNLQTAYQTCWQGTLFYHPPRECRIPEFDHISPWQPAYTWLATHVCSTGLDNRRRYAHAMAAQDSQMLFDGGWMIPLGQESQNKRLRELIGKIPPVPFYRSQIQKQPIVLRTARHKGKTWIYAVNEADGETGVTLQLSCSPTTTGRILYDGRQVSLNRHPEGGSSLSFRLEAYGIWACELDDLSAQVQEIVVDLSGQMIAGLKNRLQKLERKIYELQRKAGRSHAVLENPGFEISSNDREEIPGWELSVNDASLWRLDGQNPRSGRSSLMLTAGREEPTSLSSGFELNDNRTLVVRLWLRSDRDDAEVRLILRGTIDGKPGTHSALAKVDQQWRRYVFRVRDLPAEGMQDAGLGVELHGPGRLWVDDVEIEMQHLSDEDFKQITKVAAAISLAWKEKRYVDCRRLLDGYWSLYLLDEPSQKVEKKEKPREASRLRRLFQR